MKYELGHLPNRRGGFNHIHSGMTECGMAYHPGGGVLWEPCKRYVNHDGVCGYSDNTAF